MPDWHKNAVIYGVDVDTFQDSNGDGIGDFAGLRSRLGYLSDLGVTCLWLLPFFPTSDRDNGYDVTNYYAINPQLGSLEDFLACVREAGERGIRVIIDLVMNHTSDRHPWFQAGRRDRGTRFRDYYVWTNAPPPMEPGVTNIFPDEEPSVWTYDETAGAYYYHRFYHFEPDLNIANPEVQEEIRKVLDFWLAFGVAGFRMDAVSHMIERKGVDHAKPADPHGVLKGFRALISQRAPETVLLGEADVPPDESAAFFGHDDELNLLFNFLLDNDIFLAMATEKAEPIVRAWRQLPPVPESGQWANFLRNLDELDLERLSEAERQAVYRAFAPKETMRVFGRGIRRRLAPMLRGDRRRLELAFSLLFSMPGTPVLVYGDEIGMGDDLSLEGRIAVRTPMQWSDQRNAGFSTAPSRRLIRPVIAKGAFAYTRVNVAAQASAPDSLFQWMKRLIQVRRQCPEWGHGDMQMVDADEPSVLAHRCEWKDGTLLAVHNFAKKVCHVTLPVRTPTRLNWTRALGSAEGEPHSDGKFRVRLGPYGYGWYRLEPEAG